MIRIPQRYHFLALNTPTVISSSTHHCPFHICCPHRTLGSSLVSGSLWALCKSLCSDSLGPCVQGGGSWGIFLVGLPLPWHSPYLSQSPQLRSLVQGLAVKIPTAAQPQNFSGLGIWTAYLVLTISGLIFSVSAAQTVFMSGQPERRMFVCGRCCCLKPGATSWGSGSPKG